MTSNAALSSHDVAIDAERWPDFESVLARKETLLDMQTSYNWR
jgi:hypothetical protein